MPETQIDGIQTHFDVRGEGPALLMYSPGGFDARIAQWSDLGIYTRIRLLDHLPKHFQCILFDRRENGSSGGRVEPVNWSSYVRQGVGLLDHLGIANAHLLGGCMGCCPVSQFAVEHPKRVNSMVLYWPVGGAHYRISSHQRLARHLACVEENGLQAVVDLVNSHNKNFSADPRGGPWGQPIRNDQSFATHYASLDVTQYMLIVHAMLRGLIDRDSAPGAEPEQLMTLQIPTLIVPGADKFHATSAARFLQECIPNAQYWDASPKEQTEVSAPARVIDFLQSHQ
ncbi:MAG: alpha/beta hydrolase [Gammaproteobacteria bacterium]|nr:alpha/beta hydrolase [Gammaproteobacteria bacterium]